MSYMIYLLVELSIRKCYHRVYHQGKNLVLGFITSEVCLYRCVWYSGIEMEIEKNRNLTILCFFFFDNRFFIHIPIDQCGIWFTIQRSLTNTVMTVNGIISPSHPCFNIPNIHWCAGMTIRGIEIKVNYNAIL